MVLRTLTFKLVAKVDEELKGEIVKWSAFYEHRIKMGSVSTPVSLLFALECMI
jgi:replication factor C subunit 3/5